MESDHSPPLNTVGNPSSPSYTDLNDDLQDESEILLSPCKKPLEKADFVSIAVFGRVGPCPRVSLASLTKDAPGYSLSSLADECAKHYGFHDKMANEIGNFFLLAKVFPSSKVLKNGVRSSSSLSSAMGYPISGRILFVYPVNHGNKTGHNSAVDSFSIFRCKDLHLSLVSSKSIINTKSKPSHID
ncbi:hypothetical protein OROMI_014383 [Orobanche minor]